MQRVICELPNAASEIGGVKFEPDGKGKVVSEEIEDAVAERFASIPGYKIKPRPGPKGNNGSQTSKPAGRGRGKKNKPVVQNPNEPQTGTAGTAAETRNPEADNPEVDTHG